MRHARSPAPKPGADAALLCACACLGTGMPALGFGGTPWSDAGEICTAVRDAAILPGMQGAPRRRCLGLVGTGQSLSQGPWESCSQCGRARSGLGARDVPGGTEGPSLPRAEEGTAPRAPRRGEGGAGTGPPTLTRKAGIFLS